MSIPSWLKNNVADHTEDNYSEITLQSSAGNQNLEVWYYGEIFKYGDKDYIVGTDDAPEFIFAKDSATGESFLIFDGAKHGYDSMFCDIYDAEALAKRELKKLDITAQKLVLKLGYSIDYEDEKEDYDFNDNGEVYLISDTSIPWEQVLTDGFDYFSLYYIDKSGNEIQIADRELA